MSHAFRETSEWTSLASSDSEADQFASKALDDLNTQLSDLEVLAPFSGPLDGSDCYLEVVCSSEYWLYQKVRPIFQLIDQQGYVATVHHEDERRIGIEVQGHLAFGRLKGLASETTIPEPEIFENKKKHVVTYNITVYPLPKWKLDYDLPAESIRVDYRRESNSCFGGHQPAGVRMTHQDTKLRVEVLSRKGKPWCYDKAMQLLKAKLQSLADMGGNDADSH